ncbi:MAG TPA: 3-hydroxyacyl-CoA dehydrogenase NAD-binding domain-containing protein, partial [Caulobacterales bacterium]|nr:3-hydroxyacyl-CoA dehydrogenase NAD-binding domain-containing protein [Caulobacterales bacterium]
MSVSFEVMDGVALAAIDRPPVNAIDASIRAGVRDAVKKAAADPHVKALVIACRGRTFLSGADLSELGAEIQPPGYRETLDAIETSPKLVIAALHGTALGGGLELAMACHYRCATPSARMGMPEITLGILPGAGGTQRLPRLIGARAALEMMVSGAPITADRALELRLIDEVVGDDPIAGGLAYARRLIAAGATPRRTRDVAVSAELSEAEIAGVLEAAARALKGRTTQHDLVKLVRAAVQTPFDRGLDLEADLSAASLKTNESLALRHVFFAERECARIPGVAEPPSALPIRRAAVIGAGTMGGGIAIALADAGVSVTLVEVGKEALDKGLAGIRATYDGSLKRGRITKDALDERMGLIRGAVGLEAAADVDLVIEAVFEDMALKQSILKKLDAITPKHAVLASNTSSLSVTELGAATARPEQVIGLHFFSPANVMRLLEIVRGERTSLQTIATGLALGKALRKVGVVVGDGFGFVGNRMMLDGYFREAELMLLQGVAPERIDDVMENFGFAMGPNRVNDMAGVDVGTKVRIELAKRERRAPPYHVVSDALTPLGRLGQKVGKGVYRYEPGDRTARHDPEVDALIAKLAKEYGVAQRAVSDAEIEERCVLSLVNVGADILNEGLAYRAS